MSKVSFRILLLAGLCGGMAELVWIALYAAATGASGVDVARQVTATLAPSMTKLWFAPLLGVAVHFALAAGLAIAFGLMVWRPFAHKLNRAAGVLLAITLLVMLWAINFWIVLPVLNPAFVALMPYPVTLLSKALFGAVMVSTLQVVPGAVQRFSATHPDWVLIGICRAAHLSRRA